MEPRHEGLEYTYYDISDNTTTFCFSYHESALKPRDYGTGEEYTMLEAHTVTLIESNPGLTVTEIARRFNRTTSSISQLVTRLEAKGLLSKTWQPGDSKKVRRLYVTKKGRELSRAHVAYDEKDIAVTLDAMLEHFSMDEVNVIERFFDYWINGKLNFEE